MTHLFVVIQGPTKTTKKGLQFCVILTNQSLKAATLHKIYYSFSYTTLMQLFTTPNILLLINLLVLSSITSYCQF